MPKRASVRLLDDPYLKPYEEAVRGRSAHAFARAKELTGGKTSLAEWANAHHYYGLHFEPKKGRRPARWVFREWAPHATSMWLVGDFSGWKIDPDFEVFRIQGTDVWEREIPADRIHHLDKYHLQMRWDGGFGERIPAYARYVVQDQDTKLFSACVWNPPKRYVWRNAAPKCAPRPSSTPFRCSSPRRNDSPSAPHQSPCSGLPDEGPRARR